MRHDVAVAEIVEEVEQLKAQFPEVLWYGFGSFFNGEELFADIDMLLVCPPTADTSLIRMKTEGICLRWPIHLLILTTDEEIESHFVESEHCVLLQASEESN